MMMAPASDNLAPPQAAWIGSEHPFDLHEAYQCFRHVFDLEKPPEAAELCISADSRYKLWVNGEFIARGPARGYPHAQVVDRLDVTALLQPGKNLIAVQVYQPGYSHFAYVHRASAGLLAWLRCDGALLAATGPAWRARRDRSFAELVARVSIYGSGVEERDLALEDGWRQPDYADESWPNARVVSPAEGGLWAKLQPRALPPLAERAVTPRLLATRRGQYPTALAADAHAALRIGWSAAAPHPLEPDDDGWFSVAIDAGQAAYWLFDLGRGYAGQGWAEVGGAAGGELLSVSYVDKLKVSRQLADRVRQGAGQLPTAEPVISDPATYCRVRMTDRFRMRPGGQVAESFSLRGGRFLLFQLAGAGNAVLRVRFHARASEYPLGATRALATNDPQLARIAQMCENTFRACLADGFVDCTWRESSQWVGDALPQALIMAALTDDTRPLRRAIELAAQGAYPDGVLPSVLPGEVHAYTVVDYNFTWVELLCLYYRLTSDDRFVMSMWPTLAAMLDRFHQDLNADGLLISQPGRRLFLDWAPLARAEPSAVYNLHYLLALQTAIGLAEEHASHKDAKTRSLPSSTPDGIAQAQPNESSGLGVFVAKSIGDSNIGPIAEQLVAWRARADALCQAVRGSFWQDGCWYDDRARTTFSQLAAALAILAGAAEPGEAPALLDAIAARSLDLRDEPLPGRMVLASPFMHHYLFEALRQGERADAVVEIIRQRWGRWADAGYPTTWENWSVDFPDGSQCHAFSAHPLYHLCEIDRACGGHK